MRKNAELFILALCVMFFSAGCSSIFYPTDLGNEKLSKPKQKKSEDEVAPAKLESDEPNPITPKEQKRTKISRPKIVKVEELRDGKSGNRKYFEVIEGNTDDESSADIDEAGRPTRVVMYDNNAIQKDYSMKFNVAWGRTVEALLDMPLNTVDKPSGIITTEWIYDTVPDANSFMSLNILDGDVLNIRYKYTVRMLSKDNHTQIKIIPFAQVRKTRQWKEARPKIMITKKLFERIEQELMTPLVSDRF